MSQKKSKSFAKSIGYSYILIIFAMIVLVVIISSAFFFHMYYKKHKNDITQITELAVQNLKYEYNNIEKNVLLLSSSEVLQKRISEIANSSESEIYDIMVNISKEINEKRIFMGNSSEVKIICKDYLPYETSMLFNEKSFCEKYGISIENLNEETYIGRDGYRMLYIRPIYIGYEPGTRIGNIAFFYNVESNLRKFSDINVSNDGVFFVLEEDGTIICHPAKEFLFDNITEQGYGKKIIENEGFFEVKSGHKKYFCYVAVIPTLNWRAVSVIPMDTFFRDILFFTCGIFAVCLMFAFIVQYISKKHAKKISYPVNAMCEAMRNAESVDLNGEEMFTEFEFMSQSYNGMIVRMKQQMQEISDKETEKRKAEMRILYEQINPHFLYNTLDSINWLAAGSKDQSGQKITEMVSGLARMFRIGLSKGREIITVKEEIEHVKSYVGIQKYRYDNTFDVEYDIDESVSDCRIIKILLQPLVENSIVHGFDGMTSGGIIKIKAYGKEKDMIFVIEDNGVGCDVDYVNSIISSPNGNESKGYGLYNVQQRIKLYYGEEYGIKAEKNAGGGMKFTMILGRQEN